MTAPTTRAPTPRTRATAATAATAPSANGTSAGCQSLPVRVRATSPD